MPLMIFCKSLREWHVETKTGNFSLSPYMPPEASHCALGEISTMRKLKGAIETIITVLGQK